MAGIFFSAIALLAAATATAENADTQAERLYAAPPTYPEKCIPLQGATASRQSVTVAFSVTKEGLPESVRVVETTDACFNDAAVAAVRGWKYTPRKVGGHRQPQEGLEATFTFVFQEPTEIRESDATPKLRLPPEYPEKCARSANRSESVLVEFDVTLDGRTENIRVIDSTNSCFDKSAQDAVAKWQYNPKIVDGLAAPRKGVQTTITYELAGGGFSMPPELEFRMSVRNKLLRVQKMLGKKTPDTKKALDDLAAIEAEYGSTFTKAELAAFHQVRAAARIAAQDYKGALDDLRVCQRLGLEGDAKEGVAKAIGQLEAAIAAQEKAAASEAQGAPEPEQAESAEPQPQ